jgi:glutathione S-transferase
MPRLHLYLSPGACSLAPHILLHESGLPFTTSTVNVKAGFPDSLAHINAKRRVPVLTLDGDTITEAPAVMQAISQLCPDKQLMGSTPLERVRVAEWMNWLSGTLHGQGYGGLVRPQRYTDEPAMYDAIRAKSRKTIEECYRMIEEKLEGPHAVGGRFTAVDMYLYIFYRWGFKDGFTMDYPKFASLVVELSKREAVRKTVEVEGIDSYF